MLIQNVLGFTSLGRPLPQDPFLRDFLTCGFRDRIWHKFCSICWPGLCYELVELPSLPKARVYINGFPVVYDPFLLEGGLSFFFPNWDFRPSSPGKILVLVPVPSSLLSFAVPDYDFYHLGECRAAAHLLLQSGAASLCLASGECSFVWSQLCIFKVCGISPCTSCWSCRKGFACIVYLIAPILSSSHLFLNTQDLNF